MATKAMPLSKIGVGDRIKTKDGVYTIRKKVPFSRTRGNQQRWYITFKEIPETARIYDDTECLHLVIGTGNGKTAWNI